MRIIKNLALLILIFFVCDRAAGGLMEFLYNRQKDGNGGSSTTYVLNKANQDILVFGSSRACHHYVPRIIQDSLNESCFNAGREGRYMLYYEALLAGMVPRYKPKMIILDVNDLELCKEMDEKTQKDIIISTLLPYINKNDSIKTRVAMLDQKQILLSELFRTYPYNSTVLSIIMHNIKPGKDNLNGYLPLYGSTLPSIEPRVDSGSSSESPLLRSKLINFCSICKANGIRLAVVISPYYMRYINNSANHIKDICTLYNADFYDYSADKQFANPSFFHDEKHLNDSGAKVFTSKLMQEIKDKQQQVNNIVSR